MTAKTLSKLALLAITVILASCSGNGRNDWAFWGLKGDVKAFKERRFEVIEKTDGWEKGELELYGHHDVSFDDDGYYKRIQYVTGDNEYSDRSVPTREEGKVVEETFYDEDGDLLSRTELKYHSDEEIEFVSYNDEGEEVSKGKTMVKNNRIASQEYQIWEDGKVDEEFTSVFEYDEDGNLISQKTIDEEGKTNSFRRYEYLTFDEHNNWTERLEFDSENGDEPVRISTREYEYY